MNTGILLLVDEESRAELLARHIEKKKRFSDALSVPEWGSRERTIALIGLDAQHLHYAALACRGRQVATFKGQ